MTDRIKQVLSLHCLRHVLRVEGSGWLDPEKLTDVIDTYENSQLNVASRSVTYGSSGPKVTAEIISSVVTNLLLTPPLSLMGFDVTNARNLGTSPNIVKNPT